MIQRKLAFLALLSILLAPLVAAETLVVANKGEDTVSLIDLESGKVVSTLPTGKAPHEVAVTSDGGRALITDYGDRGNPGSTLTLIDVAQPKVLKTIDLGEYTRPHGIAWIADDTRAVVTAEGKKALIVVDVEKGKVVTAVDTGQEISHMMAMSHDEKRAFVANIGSGSMTVIDLVKGEKVTDVVTGSGAEGIAVAGRQVWVTNRAADTITVLDTATLDPLAEIESKGFPIRATATADGSAVLVTRARGGDMAIYDPSKPEAAARVIDFGLEAVDVEDRLFGDRFGDSSVPIGVSVDRAGKRAWVAHANADTITETDLATGKTTRQLKAGREPDGMGYTPVSVTP